MIVTFDATATSPHVREHATPALTAALAITAIAAATLASAGFFQLVLDIRPCPLCGAQQCLARRLSRQCRMAFLAGADRLHRRNRKPRQRRQPAGAARHREGDA